MPWFPDFVAAVELARRDTRAAGQVDPVGPFHCGTDDDDVETAGRARVSHPSCGGSRAATSKPTLR